MLLDETRRKPIRYHPLEIADFCNISKKIAFSACVYFWNNCSKKAFCPRYQIGKSEKKTHLKIECWPIIPLIYRWKKVFFLNMYKFMPAPLAPILVYIMIYVQYNFTASWKLWMSFADWIYKTHRINSSSEHLWNVLKSNLEHHSHLVRVWLLHERICIRHSMEKSWKRV